MSSIAIQSWATLTGAINRIKSPNTFLQELLYPVHSPENTDYIEFSVIDAGREIAPFVRKDGEAIMVGGPTEKFVQVSPPNIRIKKPIQASRLVGDRRAGTAIHIDQATQRSAIQKWVGLNMQYMADLITNAQEWLVSGALAGQITYQVDDQENYQITFPRPSTCNITLSVFLDDATPANVRVAEMVYIVKKVMSDEESLQPTDAICGSTAAAAIRKLAETGNLKWANTNLNNPVAVGDITLAAQFSAQGAIYMGNIGGVRFWEYPRTAMLNGVSQNMIRPKYIEFIAGNAASERVMYFGAIADFDASSDALLVSERFSKEWIEKDPSQRVTLATTRPLPCPRKPAATVSVLACT